MTRPHTTQRSHDTVTERSGKSPDPTRAIVPGAMGDTCLVFDSESSVPALLEISRGLVDAHGRPPDRLHEPVATVRLLTFVIFARVTFSSRIRSVAVIGFLPAVLALAGCGVSAESGGRAYRGVTLAHASAAAELHAH